MITEERRQHPQHAQESPFARADNATLVERAARVYYDLGVQSTNLTVAEDFIHHAIELYKLLDPAISRSTHRVLLYAKLRLGQIAAYQGRISEAFILLRAILMEVGDPSDGILRMIAWYDIGMIWLRQDQLYQALGCFREALNSCSASEIMSLFDTAGFVPTSCDSGRAPPTTTLPDAPSAAGGVEQGGCQENLLYFHPLIMDHIEFLLSCAETGSNIQGRRHLDEFIHNLSTSERDEGQLGEGQSSTRIPPSPSPETQSLHAPRTPVSGGHLRCPEDSLSSPWSIEIMLPELHPRHFDHVQISAPSTILNPHGQQYSSFLFQGVQPMDADNTEEDDDDNADDYDEEYAFLSSATSEWWDPTLVVQLVLEQIAGEAGRWCAPAA